MKYFEPSISTLRLVKEIARTGKLTVAATRLHMSQSAASHSLRLLESQLDTILFVREWEGLRVSEAGERVFPYVEQILSALDAMRAAVSDLSELKTGSLRIAGVPSLLATILPPILREYKTRYPGVELSIFEGTDDEIRAWTLSGVAQVGFAALPVDGVLTEEIAQDEWLALVPNDLFAEKSSVTLGEIAQHKFLMSGGGCELHIQRLFLAAGLRMSDHLMVKQLPTIHAMVAEKLGVSILPSLSVSNTRPGSRTIPLKPRRFRSIGMVRATENTLTPSLEAWLVLVRSRLRKTDVAAPKHSSTKKTTTRREARG